MIDAITFKVAGFFALSGTATPENPLPCCENCGHEIRNIFVIQSQSGQSMKVGSECVRILVGDDNYADAELMIRRKDRAVAQWRKATPPPLTGESRENYINRRVAEMANAMTAHRAYTAERAKLFTSKGSIGRGWTYTHDFKVVERAKRLKCSTFTMFDVQRRHVARIARKHNANPFDFTRPSWDARKV